MERCDQVWVIIDRFTKMAHFLPLEQEKKTAADLTVIFAWEIWIPQTPLGYCLGPRLAIHL